LPQYYYCYLQGYSVIFKKDMGTTFFHPHNQVNHWSHSLSRVLRACIQATTVNALAHRYIERISLLSVIYRHVIELA